MITISDILKYGPKLWKVFTGSDEASKCPEKDKTIEILQDQLNKSEAREIEQEKKIDDQDKEIEKLRRRIRKLEASIK